MTHPTRNHRSVHHRQLFLIALAALVMLLAACGPAQAQIGTPTAPARTPSAAAPTLVPTFTPTQGPTNTPVATDTPIASATPVATATSEATATSAATATNTAPPPTDTPKAIPPTATRRPPTATFTPAPPTATPKPAVDFKVLQAQLISVRENGGTTSNGEVADCGEGHNYYIKVVDANNVPLPNILVRRVYAGSVEIPPTGSKGPGMTEDVPPKYAGDLLYVMGDSGGARFTSERTPNLSTDPKAIPDGWLIAAGYCSSPSNCNYRRQVDGFCVGHYSYRITFQRSW